MKRKSRPQTATTRKRIAKSMRAHKRTAEHKENISISKKGKPLSKEHCEAIGRGQKRLSAMVAKAKGMDKKFSSAYIYVVAYKSSPGHFKIGVSVDPMRRIRALRVGHPTGHVRQLAQVRVRRAYLKEINILCRFPDRDGELVKAELDEVLAVVREEAGADLEMLDELW